jgi:hypothetical protein
MSADSDGIRPAAVLASVEKSRLTVLVWHRLRLPAVHFAADVEVRIFSSDLRASPIRSFFRNGTRKKRSTTALKLPGSSNETMCVAFGRIAS